MKLLYEKIVYNQLTQGINEAKSHFKFLKDFRLMLIKYDWSTSRRASRGGFYSKGPGVNMALHNFMKISEQPVIKATEYPSYNDDSIIGGFYSTDLSHYIRMDTLHELSHAIQYYSIRVLNMFSDSESKPHGESFKYFYEFLRAKCLNSELPKDQDKLRAMYDKMINNTIKLCWKN